MNAERDSFDELIDGAGEDGPRLSPRQRELITLIARGASNKQIARTLGITEGTVKQHLSTLYKKLGVNSRTKAIVRATELFGLRAGHPEPLPPVESSLPEDYAWRLVTAVAFVVNERSGLSVVEQTQLERGLRALHQHLKRLTEALDGQLLVAPGGDMLVGFGAPHSHLDDAARALYITRAAAAWLQDQSILDIRMGVAAAPTLVGFGNEPLYRSKAYDLAFDLAQRARSGAALCSGLVCKLGGLLFSYRTPPDDAPTSAPGLIARELTADPIDPIAFAKRIALPFTTETLGAARLSTTQWIEIAGWPPSATLQLLDGVSLHCEAGGFATYRLRLPNERDPAVFAARFHRQLRLVARLRERSEGNELYDTSTSEAMRSLAAIKLLCMRGPIALVIYGLEGLSSMTRLLRETGIAQLSTLPLIVVVAEGSAEAAPHVTARLLGARPVAGRALKTFRLPLGRTAVGPDDLHRDLATILSLLSPPARQAVRLFIAHDKKYMVTGAKTGAQHLADELVTSGLFVREGQSVICRDAPTRAALKKFFQTGDAS